jgi:hypothetical protein
MKDNNVEIFKINVFLISLNYLLIAIILVSVAFFSKGILKNAIYFGLIIIIFYFLVGLYYERLKSVEIDEERAEVKVIFSRFLLIERCITLNAKDFYFSFRSEVGAKGSEHMVFTIYDSLKQAIIKVVPFSSGWSEEKINAIIYLWRRINVTEIN